MYYDILPKIKNAMRAKKEKLVLPYSNMDFAVLKALEGAGYVKGVEKEMIDRKGVITARLVYTNKAAAVNDFKIVSKPSRHFYVDYHGLHSVRQGFGTGVISTSKGIMTDKEARRNRLGGEYLFEIW